MKTAASVMEAADLLCTDVDCIRNGDLMAVCDAVCSVECKGSYGTAFFDHLAAHGAGLTGGQVTVVAVGQVDTDLPWCPFYIVNDSDEEVRQAVDCQEQTL